MAKHAPDKRQPDRHHHLSKNEVGVLHGGDGEVGTGHRSRKRVDGGQSERDDEGGDRGDSRGIRRGDLVGGDCLGGTLFDGE